MYVELGFVRMNERRQSPRQGTDRLEAPSHLSEHENEKINRVYTTECSLGMNPEAYEALLSTS
jgi:hypothetical protein